VRGYGLLGSLGPRTRMNRTASGAAERNDAENKYADETETDRSAGLEAVMAACIGSLLTGK